MERWYLIFCETLLFSFVNLVFELIAAESIYWKRKPYYQTLQCTYSWRWNSYNKWYNSSKNWWVFSTPLAAELLSSHCSYTPACWMQNFPPLFLFCGPGSLVHPGTQDTSQGTAGQVLTGETALRPLPSIPNNWEVSCLSTLHFIRGNLYLCLTRRCW